MKLAVAVPVFPAWSETFVLRHITGMLERGIDVDILATNRPTDDVGHDLDRSRVRARTVYTGIRATHGHHVAAAARWLLRDAGLWSRLKPPALPRGVWRLAHHAGLVHAAAMLSRHPAYDVIHAHFGPRGAEVAKLRAAGAVRGVLVTSFHGHDVMAYPAECETNPYYDLFRDGDLFLANSDYTKRRLLELGCPEDRLVVHRVGVDVSRFGSTTQLRDGPDTLRITTVGRLAPEKGLEYSIRAVAELISRRQQIKIRYDIGGDGPLHGHLQRLIDDLGVGSNVRLLGWQTQQQVQHLLERTDVFVLASISTSSGAAEAAGLALAEAQASGIPVVATHVGGIPEMIRDNVTGLLVRERGVPELVAALTRLADDADMRAHMAQEGYRFARSHFDADRLNHDLLELYRQCLSQRCGCRTA